MFSIGRAIHPERQEVGQAGPQAAGNQLTYRGHVRVSLLKKNSLAICLLLFGCSNEQDTTDKFLNEKLSCPSPAVAEFEAWGKSGTQQICKIKHGPFVAWENGYVHVRGQYENGKEVGEWLWYDASGNVVKKIDYSKTQTEK